ncbi:hypothetical protein [Leucobacter massiliensis]|uniref:Uncharacterized protein n=1 Tax=Leucobacter massiliensis TaxID=1686285 RepID=A0A2S9QSE5_9MICO|nr:hypothetical protein [Leucobacter massiliensis]PRI12511.1 hypothetical protein B4915_00945 [Leucobacter massiliensis]
MSTIQRAPWGERTDPKRVSWMIEGAYKERFEKLAEHAGVSAAVFLERVIEHLEDELTDRGLPNWWPQPELKDGELPIDTA